MRVVACVVHPGRAAAVDAAEQAVRALVAQGLAVCVDSDDDPTERLRNAGARHVALDEVSAEIVIAFGGDGTVLRAAEVSHAQHLPLLGVNLGHVGFLAEADVDAIPVLVDAVVSQTYTVEKRMALSVQVEHPNGRHWQSWALNEVGVERAGEPRIIELGVAIDGEPLSRYGGDGLVCATPTGSTAYAFSAGGPVIWAEVEAMCVVPVSAHALFARPMIVAPSSEVTVEMLSSTPAMLWADGRRGESLTQGTRITVVRHADDVLFARLHTSPFTRRLVAKFELPLTGWRDRGRT
ncbi:MAG: NAD kinase [Actinobacteria bacterium]|nr:NAD kinase [Actinomycetota bacterium]